MCSAVSNAGSSSAVKNQVQICLFYYLLKNRIFQIGHSRGRRAEPDPATPNKVKITNLLMYI